MDIETFVIGQDTSDDEVAAAMEKFRINGVTLPRDIFSNSYGKEG